MLPEHRNSMVALMDCLTDLQNFGNHHELIKPVELAIRRCANLMTGKKVCNTFKNSIKKIYDEQGKIPAIREYREVMGCDLITAKKQVEEWFPYTSSFHNI